MNAMGRTLFAVCSPPGATTVDLAESENIPTDHIHTDKYMHLLGISISTWGPQSERFLKLKAFDGNLLFMVEHRQPTKEIQKMHKSLKQSNWTVSIAAATL